MKINDHVYRLDSTKSSNCFLVFDEELVLIDTGHAFVGKRMLKEIQEMNIAPTDIKHILLTHHDIDHIGNVRWLQEITGATVWAHEEDIPYITGTKDRPGFKKYIGKLAAKKYIKDIEPYGSNMKVGNIQIIYTPGHTPGHVCMLYNDVLFAGDLVEHKRNKLTPFPNAWNWDTQKLQQSIDSLKNTEYEWVCMAHGKPCQQRITID
ncbi:MBL fold metallo-hydrolase [Vallitalea okinawensis]|uniref:MBL fold metallo-hydrolase n=1 Tax=Vallitalea okinawensis TaxID=2078660 RepID=UPI000CFCEDEA|nr:MBL fold metallo-hydrolase [Vallitalea okinawensis]